MPQYPVLQPNGNLAVWSTIVDCFIALDCTPEEAAEVLGQRYSDKVKVVQAITAIKNGEQPREEWNDWAECVAWAMFRFGAEDETVKQAMTLTPDPMTRRYITTFVALIQAEGAQQDAEWLQEQAQAQLAAVTAERDDYRSKFREMERETELLRSQLIAMQTRAETAEARLLALQVDRSKAVKLRDETDNVIWSLKPDDVPGAINWGDLGCREVQEVISDERRWYRVVIEEADPSNDALHAAVWTGLRSLGWNTNEIEIETAW